MFCRAVICGCMVEPEVCKQCDDLDEVTDLVKQFSKALRAQLCRRSRALKRLGQILKQRKTNASKSSES